jgi:regulator of sigma E protease
VLLTIAAFVFVLGVLIFVHELGHFLAAKAVGIGVPRFSIGFGPATPIRFRRGETEYVVAWIPLGGYVKMASREEQEAMASLEGGSLGQEYEDFPEDQLFESKSLWARILVISAGVAMNALFAWVTYATLAAVFGRNEDTVTAIAHVDAAALPPEAAALAALPRGVTVAMVNGDSVQSWDQVLRAIADPTSDRLRFDFAEDLDAVILPIRGTEVRARAAIGTALYPLWGPEIGSIISGMPAAAAGLQPGDVLVAVEDDTVAAFYDLKRVVEPRIGDSVRVAVQRADSLFAVTLVPVERRYEDPITGETRLIGQVGIGPAREFTRIRYGPAAAVVEGARVTWSNVELVFFTLKGIVFREVSPRDIGGPILIGQMSGQVARFGFVALVEFMALLSVNLAILNLLPIPVLDGGHLVFLLIEGARGGRPLSVTARMRLTQMGLVVLLALMIFVFTNDILRIFGG